MSNQPLEIGLVTENESLPDQVFSNRAPQTYKTDKTISITNEQFLEAIFGSVEQEVQPVLVSFVGHPHKVDKRNWAGWDRKRAIEDGYLSNGSNNYFSVSSFTEKENGSYARLKKYFFQLHAIMLDDVGTKVALNDLKLAPSAMIETSEGNHQAIYILSQPEASVLQADKLMNAVIAAGLCDKGASGPASRLARLPCATNGKHNPPFPCRLWYWHPEHRYTVEELVHGLGLVNFFENGTHKKSKQPKTARPTTGDQIHFAADSTNPVLQSIKDKGLYKTPLGDGKHDMTCPWVHEHSNAEDNGTCYYEPDDTYQHGGFHCFHGHCDGRTIKDLLAFLQIEQRSIGKKPLIHANPGELDKIIDIAERTLAQSGRYYQRGNTICIVTTSPENKETLITPINQPTIRVALAHVADWEKYNATVQEFIPIDPPAAYAAALYDQPAYDYLPILHGLARQPYLRPDGSLMLSPGYDAQSGMFGVFSVREFDVPENPTKEQARVALLLLQKLVEEFCFKEEADRAAALSAMLTAAIRVSLPKAPLYHVRAPQIGSGKSYLNELIAAFCTPHSIAPTTFPDGEEECKKLLLSSLLTSPAVINFDNLTIDLLPLPSLCAVLTEEYFSSRILGVSKTASVSTRTLFLSSGNNVGPIQDMGRRCITIDLDAKCETPAGKTYKSPTLLYELRAQRGQYVSAALTIIRAWIIAGSPRAQCKPLASYGIWSDLCCQPIMWLGLANPMTSAFEAMNDDPEREVIGRLMEYWQGCFGRAPAMVRDLVAESCTNLELREILEDIALDKTNNLSRKTLGRWLKRHERRVVNGLRFVPDDGKRSAKAWRLETVT